MLEVLVKVPVIVSGLVEGNVGQSTKGSSGIDAFVEAPGRVLLGAAQTQSADADGGD